MAVLKYDYDMSDNKKVELYLFWIPQGNQVDVAIYIHQLEANEQARLSKYFYSETARSYIYSKTENGDIPVVHTQYFEYTIGGPPQDILADLTTGAGGASRAHAIAL